MDRASLRRGGKAGLQRLQQFGLVRFHLEQIVAAVGFQQFQQRPPSKDGVAGQQAQGRIGRQQFDQMPLKAARLIRLVAADGPFVNATFIR